jgi:hypothetical protein
MKMFKTMNYLLISMIILACMACDTLEELSDELENSGIAVCPEVCLNIESCGATPPPPANLGSLGDSLPSNGIAACATNCAQTDSRHRLGYSDCQIECLQSASCNKMNDCWDTRSDTYKQYCLKGVEVPEITPAPAPEPEPGEPEPEPMMSIDNGTVTGNEEVDNIVQDPAIAVAIENSDTPVNFGDTPPNLQGEYAVEGSIDRAANARAPGSPIRTAICFEGTQSLAGGSSVTYCERGVPGIGNAPITGQGNSFSTFFEIDGAPVTILFSGALNEDSSVTGAEALVTYTVGTDVWEHSNTDWVQANPSCTCPL